MAKYITILQTEEKFKLFLYREGMAESTKKAYLRDLNFFRGFLKDKLNNKVRYINQITLVEIREFKDYMLSLIESGEVKRSTISRKFNTLKTYFNFLEQEYHIKNIIKKDKFGNKKESINSRNSIPETLNMNEINMILNTIKNSTDKNKYRDFAIFQVLASLGCRRSEVLELKWQDVDFYQNTIRITREKTKNSDILPLSMGIKNALLYYRDTLPAFGEYIFQTRQSGKMSISTFTTTVNKWIRKSKIEEIKGFRITAHTFRHTFITALKNKGVDDNIVMRFSGHKDKRSLEIYTHLNYRDLENVNSIIESLFTE